MAQDAAPMPVRSSSVPTMRAATLGLEQHGAVRTPSFFAMSGTLVNDSQVDLLGWGGTLGSAGDGAGLGLVAGPGEAHGVPTAAGSAGGRGGSGRQQLGAC